MAMLRLTLVFLSPAHSPFDSLPYSLSFFIAPSSLPHLCIFSPSTPPPLPPLAFSHCFSVSLHPCSAHLSPLPPSSVISLFLPPNPLGCSFLLSCHLGSHRAPEEKAVCGVGRDPGAAGRQ